MKTVVSISNFSNLKIGVVIHPDNSALLKEYNRGDKEKDNDVWAFCHFPEDGLDGNVLAVLHFSPEHLDVCTIAHECFHAVVAMARYFFIDCSNNAGEEVMAESLELAIAGVQKFKRSLEKAGKSSRRPSAKRRRNYGLSSGRNSRRRTGKAGAQSSASQTASLWKFPAAA